MKNIPTAILSAALCFGSVPAHAWAAIGVGYQAACTYTVTAQGGTSRAITTRGYSIKASLKRAKKSAIRHAEIKVETEVNRRAKDVCEEHGCGKNEEFVVSVNMISGSCFAGEDNPVLFNFANINWPNSLTRCVDSCVD